MWIDLVGKQKEAHYVDVVFKVYLHHFFSDEKDQWWV